MMVRSSTLFATLAAVASVYAADIACSLSQKCPSDLPCCSQYGVCGVGAYCLGGCDPRMSNSLDSCVPEPVCKSKTYSWKDLSGITSKNTYLGDASKTDWVMDGEAVPYQDTLLLTMAPGTVGTVLASSDYMWYGNVEATFKTSRGAGVVTAFILFSDVKDEIDYEFVGTELTEAQTNYYFQGIPLYTQGGKSSVSDTFLNYHTYRIQWTPDKITWLIDGKEIRTKLKSDTWNATTNSWDFPQTPARVQLSIWPGGLPSNAEGTITWAGGLIDFTSKAPDIANNGYYYAQFKSVSVECYNANSAPGTNKGTSYHYNNINGLNTSVVDGDKPTVLKSLLGSGTNMSAVPASAQTSEIANIPGLNGAGPGIAAHTETATASSNGNSAANTDGSNVLAPASTATGFTQFGQSAGTNTNLGASFGADGKRTLGASLFAAVLAVGAMLVL